MGYETTDYSYTYKDLSSLSADSDSKVIRGEESGVTRVYSVAEAEKFIKAIPRFYRQPKRSGTSQKIQRRQRAKM